ncbi:MAG: TcaA 3rd/4th domain-containing protein [Clostridium sp.]
MEKLKVAKEKINSYIEKFKVYFEKIDVNKIFNEIKNKKYYILAMTLIIVLTLILVVDSSITTKKELIKNLEISIDKCRSSKIYGDIFIDEEKVGKNDIDPLLKFYNDDETKVNKLISELNSRDKSGVLTIKKHKKLFRQNYYFEVDTVGIKVKSNYENSKIFIDGNLLNEGNVKIGLIPGLHTVKLELQTYYGNVEKEVEVALMQNEEVFVQLDAVDLNLTSNFQDAIVLINDSPVKETVSTLENLGPIPTNKDLNIQLQREFPWGVIKSEKVKISDVPNLNLDINMVNEELISQVKGSIDEFYTSIFNALNERDKNLIVLTNDDIKDKIYNEINKKTVIFKNNYEIKELETKIENSEFVYKDNKYTGKIVVKINYSVYKKIFSLFQSKEENMFLTDIELVGDKWIINDIQKFEMQ